MKKRHAVHAIVLSLAAVTATVAVDARQVTLEGMPADRNARGDAFVEAWLAFRRDLDSLFGLGVHPGQYRTWIEQMPGFLLRDAARLSTSHDVIIDVTTRLATLGGEENRALIRRLKGRYENTTLDRFLRIQLIRSGDRAALSAALRDLNHQLFARRFEGALALAGAGRPEGYKFLRDVFQGGRKGRGPAIVALGRFGKAAEAKFITAALRRSPLDTALRVAHGELVLKERFPYHYRAIASRYPAGHSVSRDGIYETWLTVIDQAFTPGRGGSEVLFKTINAMRRSPPGDREPELLKRQLGVLHEFWSAMDARLASGLRFPSPKRFADAMTAVSRKRERKEAPEAFVAARVSAAIAVLASLGEPLGYPALAAPTPGLSAISPLGERAVDGNLATSWPVKTGSTLVLEHDGRARLDALLFMVSCPGRADKGVLQVDIAGRDWKHKAWRRRATLGSGTRYFQRAAVGRESAGRITVEVSGVKGRSLACVSEIRAVLR
jgi:hypothetical protein